MQLAVNQPFCVPFPSYLTFQNVVSLKSTLDVTPGNCKWQYSIAHEFLFVFHYNYGHFFALVRNSPPGKRLRNFSRLFFTTEPDV